ncbi:Hypothetical predicted protein [Lecanosticta acicola]|uniref:Uncharacterized protein n=1 Tax=Lecanosticta acicola TaxID=111012 RepID=A0AAI9EF85_9PEZI|nr:Hypothetical predicted protein [Lecanosticta acicola]
MALNGSVPRNDTLAPSPADEEELYTQLLRLQDAVVSGKHPHFKLPPAAIEQLKASLALVKASPAATTQQPAVNGLLNGAAFSANAATNYVQLPPASKVPAFPGLPGLHTPIASASRNASTTAAPKTTPSGLNPIFLEKSDSLVRAESSLKRQRIERDVQTQMEQRKHHRDKDSGSDPPSALDVESILAASRALETHVTGLRLTRAGSASSFDTNDYYSSQVESDWSSPASKSKGSDNAAGPFAGDFERLEGPSGLSFPPKAAKHATRNTIANSARTANVYNEDEDDEYTPPDAAAFDSFQDPDVSINLAGDEDDNSEYEPGEIAQESNVPTQYYQGSQAAHPSPQQVPVIRNHLTHIAAPQPNRVSPLAVAKGPSIELELVNGRPEVVAKPHPNSHAIQSRASTASPANGVNGSNKKRRNKKRKRDEPAGQPSGRGKRKRDRQVAAQSPISPANREPRIKDEPVSPPPFANIPDAHPYAQRSAHYRPTEIDLVSPRLPPQMVYAPEPPRPALRYEYAQPTSPAVVRVASPAAYRPVQRDTQDLRRIASMHYAQRQPSPTQHAYSPVPQRTVSMTYGDPRLPRAPAEVENVRYAEVSAPDHVQYVRADRSRSPPQSHQYQDPYARAHSPALMPPPAAPPRAIVVDQYGNRYYASEPAPPSAPSRASVAPVDRHPMIDSGYAARASVAPVDRRPAAETGYDRASSRMAYAAPAAYEQPETSMAPPPPRREVQYVDANGYPIREYSSYPAEQIRYVEAPTSPNYQQRYEQMPPPAAPAREQTSPVYVPTRSYSVRPDAPPQAPAPYAARQASVAPVQYARQEASLAPTRAMSVAPGYEGQARAYSHAPAAAAQQVRYVDQYGREVYPEVRQVPAGDYRYQ